MKNVAGLICISGWAKPAVRNNCHPEQGREILERNRGALARLMAMIEPLVR